MRARELVENGSMKRITLYIYRQTQLVLVFVVSPTDCYDDNGRVGNRAYVGRMNVTASGKPCKKWDGREGSNYKENFCRWKSFQILICIRLPVYQGLFNQERI